MRHVEDPNPVALNVGGKFNDFVVLDLERVVKAKLFSAGQLQIDG
jgi:hypothetical protein